MTSLLLADLSNAVWSLPFKGQTAKAKAPASAIFTLLTAELGVAVRVRAECIWCHYGQLQMDSEVQLQLLR